MCGIVGCILKDNRKAAPVLLDCAKKLEYRGYDSVGLATYDEKIHVKKDEGYIESVDEALDLADMPGNYGIAHVRWASVGKPSKLNSHPHLDEEETVAVVHNGTITNYTQLKNKLIDEGHKFISQTDTEVISHLMEKFMDEELDLEHALRKSIGLMDGSYAIVAISRREPNKIVATRKDSPLVLGQKDGSYYLASDIPAMIKYTNDIIELNKGEIVVITNEKMEIHDEEDNIIERKPVTIDWTPEMVEKNGYKHYMLKEIYDQPEAVRRTLSQKDKIRKMLDDIGEIEKICIVACGTSYHAALSGKYIIESEARIPTNVVLASEFTHSLNIIDEKTLLIGMSQSGETADTIKALNCVEGPIKLAIVNVGISEMTKIVDYTILTKAGPELSVAATKTYTAQVTVMYMIAAILGDNEGLLDKLNKVPEYIEDVLNNHDDIKSMATAYLYANELFYIGKGFSYPTALEAALKMKEISYIHAEAYASGELKHGPLALIDNNMPVITIIPPGKDKDLTLNSLEEVKARNSRIVTICSKNDEIVPDKSEECILIKGDIDEIIAPLVYIVPLQLLAYYITLEKGYNPDRPRNLAKTVTV